MAKVRDITALLEHIAPTAYQESNAGLITGFPQTEITSILITLDCIESVVEEAITKNCNLIIAHHPIIFKGLKQLNGKNYVERTIIKAIKHDIAIYAIHTNLDNVHHGVNAKIAEKLKLNHPKVLYPKKGSLMKLETFVPADDTETVLNALHQSGAGHIGNYSNCSFSVSGMGTFKPDKEANPTIGKNGKQEKVPENKLELIFPKVLEREVIRVLHNVHPYEEVAYYLHTLENTNQKVGSGIVGELNESMTTQSFLEHLKNSMALNVIRYTSLNTQCIKKVAVCGGAGSFLLNQAKSIGADAFVTADFKYHEFFDAEGKILVADIGHYESEVFTKELVNGFIRENFPNIAACLSEVDTNPVKYF